MSSGKRIWDLIAKKLSGEADAAELKELEGLLRAHPDMHYPMQHVADLWHHKSPPDAGAYDAFERHAQRMKSVGIDFAAQEEATEDEPNFPAAIGTAQAKKIKWPLTAGMALAVAACVAAGLFFYKPAAPSGIVASRAPAYRSEVSTKYGSRTKLVLPDGTQVWLNAGSRLTYDKAFGTATREVALTGEAYFDVAKNAARPFVIHAPGFNIKVLGTAFNVRSFPGEKKSETSLIRGSIEVTFSDRPAEKIVLKPNEKLVIANEDLSGGKAAAPMVNKKESIPPEPLVAVSHLTYEPSDSTIVETSWMANKLIFRSESFEDLAPRMERWYGVHISFASEDLKKKRFTGTFENETIQQALKALQYSWPFRYTISKQEILLSR